MTPRVYSKRRGAEPAPPGAVCVDRSGPWGNTFEIGKDGTRAEVIAMFEAWLYDPESRAYRERVRRELRGRDLVCWCAPLPCHADVLLALANEAPR